MSSYRFRPRRNRLGRIWRPLAIVGVGMTALSAAPAWGAVAADVPTAGTWGTNGRVTEILPLANGQKVIAGSFSAVVDPSGVSHPVANLAMFDASGVWVSSWTAGTDGEVDALASAGDRVYVGGQFNQVDGKPHKGLAAVDLTTGALDRGFVATVTGQALALTATSDALFVGGTFTQVKTGAGPVDRSRLAKLDLATGAVDPGWVLKANDKVRSLVLSTDQSTLYLGGDFAALNNTIRWFSAAASTADVAQPLLPYQITLVGNVFKQTYSNGVLYIAANGGLGGTCSAVDALTGNLRWRLNTNGNVQSVTVAGGTAYCGGHFSTIASLPRQHIAALDATSGTVLPWMPRVNSSQGVWALANNGTQVLAGGDFTKIGRLAINHYAEFAA